MDPLLFAKKLWDILNGITPGKPADGKPAATAYGRHAPDQTETPDMMLPGELPRPTWLGLEEHDE